MNIFIFAASNFVFHVPTSCHPSLHPVSHLSSQPALITSPPPRGSYFLIARPSCSGIPEINSPPLCYSYYLGVLELACPSKRTLYSCTSFPPSSAPPPPPAPSLTTLSVVIHYRRAWGTCPRAAEVSNGQRYSAEHADIKDGGMMKRC